MCESGASFLFVHSESESTKSQPPEPVFVNLLSSQESIPILAGRYDNPICRSSPLAYIGWQNRFLRNRFLGSINVYKYGLS